MSAIPPTAPEKDITSAPGPSEKRHEWGLSNKVCYPWHCPFFMNAHGLVTKILDKIIEASQPDRFTIVIGRNLARLFADLQTVGQHRGDGYKLLTSRSLLGDGRS
jgi:hypothetical protein